VDGLFYCYFVFIACFSIMSKHMKRLLYSVEKFQVGGPLVSRGSSSVATGEETSNKKISPEEWDRINSQRGYQPLPSGRASGYREYFNPKEYMQDETGGFIRVADKGKVVNYNNDPTYRPFVRYAPPVSKPKPARIIPQNNRKVEFGPTGPVITYNDGRTEYYNNDGQLIQPITKSRKGGKMKYCGKGGLLYKTKK
jgi:hypothetical protein